MAKPSPWPAIHEQRKALAADLEALSDAQWATPSLCEGWSVRQTLGHMTGTASMTPLAFFPRLIASGFRLSALQAKDIAKQTEGTPANTLARFKEKVDSSSSPPGPADTWLGETLVHAEDIRRPLGIKHEYPLDAVTRVADFYRGSNLVIGGKKRVAGLTLKATDTDWSAGEGPEVSGPAVALMMAVAGRKAALDDLTGPGLDTLKQRF